MTQLLERAFAVASKLPGPEQDAFASLLLAELDSEQRWTAAFSTTQNQLAALADEALREFAAGQTQPMNLECAAMVTLSCGISLARTQTMTDLSRPCDTYGFYLCLVTGMPYEERPAA